MRGIKIPFAVDFISSKEELFGVVVPKLTLPVDGKVFVWAFNEANVIINKIIIAVQSCTFIRIIFSSKIEYVFGG